MARRHAINSRRKPTPTAAHVAANAERVETAQKMITLSDILSRGNLGRQLAGVQYGGRRDIYEVAGYIRQGHERFADYWAMYKRNDIAGRIVDMPAKTTWRTPPEVCEAGAEGTNPTQFMQDVQGLIKTLKLWHYCERADRLCGVGKYAVLFIGVRGVDDTGLRQPLSRVRNAKDIIYLSVYNEFNAEIIEWEKDTGNERYGMPKMYRLKTSSPGEQQQQQRPNMQGPAQLTVHASRVLHIAEDLLEDDVYGRPRLERCLNRLFDLDKVAAATGEAYWQNAARILQAKIDPTAEIDATQLKALDEKLGEMVHDLSRQFYGQGVGLEWLTSDTPNVSQVADFYFSLIAAAANVPKRILFGNEQGSLASATDQETYLGQINERQEQFAEPMILRAFVDKMIAIGAVKAPKGGEYDVIWPTLFEESDVNKADANLKRAQTAAALTPIGGNPRELVEIDGESNVKLIERSADESVDVTVDPALDVPPSAEGDLGAGQSPGIDAGTGRAALPGDGAPAIG